MTNRYLKTRYERGGRGPDVYDCWGIVRAARQDLFGRSLLPSYGRISPDDKPALTVACHAVEQAHGFRPCQPRPGAIATAWCARLCVHIGIVVEADERLWVLETDDPTGPCLTPLSKFASRYTKVIYYDD